MVAAIIHAGSEVITSYINEVNETIRSVLTKKCCLQYVYMLEYYYWFSNDCLPCFVLHTISPPALHNPLSVFLSSTLSPSPTLSTSFSAALTSPHLNVIEFVCAANGSPNATLILPVKCDECLHALAAQSMLVIIFLIWLIPPHPTLPANEIISHFDN